MPNHTTSPLFTRRRLLGTAAAGVAAAAVGGPLLSGCSGASESAGGSGASVTLPTYVPFTGVKPDLAGDPTQGVMPGFFRYPSAGEQVKTVEGDVGTGGDFSSFVISYSPPPAALDKNAYWQAINKAMNVNYTSTLVPTDFDTKLAAMLTSDDLPDIVTMHVGVAYGLRKFEALAQSKFADLSDKLSGDGVKAYPNLARLPTDTWRYTLVDGRIFSTPTLRIPTNSVAFTRSDVISELGANPTPASAEEFEAMCKEVTDPNKSRYALANGQSSWLSSLFYPMFGLPNAWKANDDGTLVRDIETEGWVDAIAFVASLWKKGYWHPDSPTASSFDVEPLFTNGSVLVVSNSFVRYTVRGKLTFTVDVMPPFAADGGQASVYEGAQTDLLTFIKKGDDARVEESLRVINYLSAPFGSQENFLRTFGPEGTDHTLVDGVPTLTERGDTETNSLCLRFIAGGPDVLFAANGDSSMVKKLHAYQEKAAPRRLTNPTLGLYTEAVSQSSALEKQVTDTVNDVVLGRKPTSALTEAVTSWRANGGDKLREGYQEALAKQSGR